MGIIQHVKTDLVADGTDTNVVRPSDWNSAHAYTLVDGVSISGNTAGAAGLISSGTVYLAGGNNITLSQNANSITVSAGNAQVKISAGTMSAARTDVTFGDTNGVSFGLDTNGVVTASVVTSYLQNVRIVAGTGIGLRSDFTISNGNGVSWGMNNGVITATVQTNYLTTAMASDAATISNIKISAGTSSANRSDLTFGDSNGVSWGLNTNGVVTATVRTNYVTAQTAQSAIKGFGASNTGNTAGNTGISTGIDWVVAGTNNITISQSTTAGGPNTVWISGATAAGGGLTNIKVSAGTLSANRSDVTFSDSNGVSWGLNTNGAVTATVKTDYQTSGAYLTTAMASNAGSNFVAATAAFNGTNASGTIASNGISVSVAAPGGGYALQYYEADDQAAFGLMTNLTGINTRPIFVPFVLKGSLTNNSLIVQVSRATSGSNLFTLQAGLYTYSNATKIALVDSLSAGFSGSNTASLSGVRYLVATGWGTNATALTPGAYVLALNFSANSTVSMNYSLFGGVTGSAPVGFIAQGSDANNTTNTTWGVENFWGRYSAGSGALPAAAGQSDIVANFSGASLPIAPWFVLRP